MPNETGSIVDQIIKKLGLPTETGTLRSSRGKYYFVTTNTRKQIVANPSTENELAKLAGKKVVAVLSGKSIITLFPLRPPVAWKPRRILCYYPVPDLIKRIDPQVERAIREQFVAEGVLTRVQAEILEKIEVIGH